MATATETTDQPEDEGDEDEVMTSEDEETRLRDERDEAAAYLGSARTAEEATEREAALRSATDRWLTSFVALAREEREGSEA
jgi:hypothetical protein